MSSDIQNEDPFVFEIGVLNRRRIQNLKIWERPQDSRPQDSLVPKILSE